MKLSSLKVVVLVFALIALPLQAVADSGPGGCPGTDAAMSAMQGGAGDPVHHDSGQGSHPAGAHSPQCGACPAAGSALPGALLVADGAWLEDAPVRSRLHLFRSFSPEPDKRPPLASA